MTILRDITNDKHREVENLPMIQSLLNGKMNQKEYVFYLYELHHIYGWLERLAKEAGVLDGLEGIERTESIKKDLIELDPDYERDIFPSTYQYVQYLCSLFLDQNKRHLLMAHVYTRHMGDLYGGKLISRVVPGSGLAYQFEDRPKIIKAFNEKLTLEMGDEANVAFDWFIKIFTEMGDHIANI